MNLIYEPKNLCKDYFDISGSNQLPMFIAVVEGIKPLMDDWINTKDYLKFVNLCDNYNLHIEPEWIFLEGSEESINSSIDSSRLTTTKAFGIPFNKNSKEGRAHIFISKSKNKTIEAKKWGWYPLIIGGRSLHKPFIDYMRFGKCLGYPNCCIDFFKKYNNHNLYNHPYETFKNTKGKPNFLCNNLFMDHTYSLIHHLPCSYNCEKTIFLAQKLLEVIEKKEPEFAEQIKYYLKLPLLIFQEGNIYAFEGKSEGNNVHYKDFLFLGRPIDNKYNGIFRKGNNLVIEDYKIDIFKDNQFIFSIPKEKKENGFLLQFQ